MRTFAYKPNADVSVPRRVSPHCPPPPSSSSSSSSASGPLSGPKQNGTIIISPIRADIFRTGLMNCTYPLEESILMDSVAKNTRVPQLRHHFGPLLTHFAALCTPPIRDRPKATVCYALLIARAYRMLIWCLRPDGVRDSIHSLRPGGRAWRASVSLDGAGARWSGGS